MDFSEQAIEELNVNKDALTLRRMIREIIHNQQDLEELKIIVKNNAANKLFKCLCELSKIKNNERHKIA